MKQYADWKRTERKLEGGDMVYLKLQPHRPLSVLESNSSLLPKFYGPYQAEAKVGEIAYRLKLPQKAQIHLGFHVFLLKKN